MDAEARERGTSVYLVDRVIPMLPPVLSTEVCSLNPEVRRFAISLFLELDQNGMRMDRLEETLRGLAAKGVRPKYIYTIPTLQNPTGTVMTMERRREMLRLSIEYGVPIFEDECYADLIFEGEYENAIRSLDDSSHVLHIGSFSKTFFSCY